MARFNALFVSLFILLASTLVSCEAIGSIFKAGVWTGLILVVVVIIIVIWLISRMRK